MVSKQLSPFGIALRIVVPPVLYTDGFLPTHPGERLWDWCALCARATNTNSRVFSVRRVSERVWQSTSLMRASVRSWCLRGGW